MEFSELNVQFENISYVSGNEVTTVVSFSERL